MDTIFALATAPGKSGLAVIRVSGALAVQAAERLAGALPKARTAGLRALRTVDGSLLDEALVLVFEAPASFTGETVVELQCHGSVAVVTAVLEALSEIPGLRQAEAGEFTRRALENGQLDLVQVEALADLVEAETDAQRRLALEGFSGRFAEEISDWREKLIRASALLESGIDFAEEDVPEDVNPEVMDLLSAVTSKIRHQINGLHAAERIRSGFEVAIVGSTNVGKSTLLNALAGRDAAITSDIAGTTRDVIEVRMDIGGLAVTLLDTAGLRKSADVVENIGMERARKRAAAADIRIHIVEDGVGALISPEDEDILLIAKDDHGHYVNGISGITGRGVEQLLSDLESRLRARVAGVGLANRVRHKVILENTLGHLTCASDALKDGALPIELVAEEVRTASLVLAGMIGQIDVEEVLGEIFSSFCIGK